MTTEPQRYNGFTRNGGNAVPKHAGPEAKGSNPTAGLTLLWARNPFRGNFNHWQVSPVGEKPKSCSSLQRNFLRIAFYHVYPAHFFHMQHVQGGSNMTGTVCV